MPLLDTDRELARDSYYAATARREQAFPALAGDATTPNVINMAAMSRRRML